MKFMLNGQIVDEDNISIIVPGVVIEYITDLQHFVADHQNNIHPIYWQYNRPEFRAFAVQLKTGEKILVTRMYRNGEYERLERYRDDLKDHTFSFSDGPKPMTQEELQEREKAAAAARLKKELDF